MGSKLIEVYVFKDHDGTAYPDVEVKIGGYDNLVAKTDKNGKATLILPFDSGSISIYANGKEVFNGYLYEIHNPLVVKLPYSIW